LEPSIEKSASDREILVYNYEMVPSGRSRATVIADGLTVLRFVVAIVLIPATWSLSLGVSAWLVSVAWVTDVLDGRLARAVGEEGWMGRWDLTADTAVGAGLLVGLAGSGEIPAWFAIAVLAILGTLFLLGNFAASMLLQVAAYSSLIILLWSRRPSLWWLPMVAAVMIGIIDWRRLLQVNIPGFLHAFRQSAGRGEWRPGGR
jgi:phosphatidylglycerophosphate synthase